MILSLGQLKKELDGLGISTSTPGLVGEDRFEELQNRLQKTSNKPSNSINSTKINEQKLESAGLPLLSLGEIRSRLVSLGESTNTPGLTGEERRQELMNRLITAICGSQQDAEAVVKNPYNDMPAAVYKEIEEATPIKVVETKIEDPIEKSADDEDTNESSENDEDQININRVKNDMKRLANRRAILIASKLAGDLQDEDLRNCEEKLAAVDRDLSICQSLLQKGEKVVHISKLSEIKCVDLKLIVNEKRNKSCDVESVKEILNTQKIELKDQIRYYRQRIREMGEDHPEYGLAAEEALKLQLSSANLYINKQKNKMMRLKKKTDSKKQRNDSQSRMVVNESLSTDGNETVQSVPVESTNRNDGMNRIRKKLMESLEMDSSSNPQITTDGGMSMERRERLEQEKEMELLMNQPTVSQKMIPDSTPLLLLSPFTLSSNAPLDAASIMKKYSLSTAAPPTITNTTKPHLSSPLPPPHPPASQPPMTINSPTAPDDNRTMMMTNTSNSKQPSAQSPEDPVERVETPPSTMILSHKTHEENANVVAELHHSNRENDEDDDDDWIWSQYSKQPHPAKISPVDYPTDLVTYEPKPSVEELDLSSTELLDGMDLAVSIAVKPAPRAVGLNEEDEDKDFETMDSNDDGDDDDEEEDEIKIQIKVLRSHAKLLERNEDYNAAEVLHERALELDPTSIRTLEGFARFLHHRKGEVERAEAFYKRAIQLCFPGFNPSSSQKSGGTNSNLATIIEDPEDKNNGRGDASISAVNGIKMMEVTQVCLNYAKFLTKARGDVEAASAVYRKMIEVDPNNAHVLASFAHFLTEEGSIQSNEAIELFKRSLQIDPTNAMTAMWYAKHLKRIGKLGQAELMYKVAMEQSKSNKSESMEPLAICNYATFIFKYRKNPEKAQQLFEDGLQRFAGHMGLTKNYCTLLKVHKHLGDADEVKRLSRMSSHRRGRSRTANSNKLPMRSILGSNQDEYQVDTAIESNVSTMVVDKNHEWDQQPHTNIEEVD